MAVPTQNTGRSNEIEARILESSLLLSPLCSHSAVLHKFAWKGNRTDMPLRWANLEIISNPLFLNGKRAPSACLLMKIETAIAHLSVQNTVLHHLDRNLMTRQASMRRQT